MSIEEITDHYFDQYIKSLEGRRPIDLRSIIFQAVQAGMADAYAHGIKTGKGIK